jgi:hypothetical protein
MKQQSSLLISIWSIAFKGLRSEGSALVSLFWCRWKLRAAAARGSMGAGKQSRGPRRALGRKDGGGDGCQREAKSGAAPATAMAKEWATAVLWWWRWWRWHSGDGDALVDFGSLTASLWNPPDSRVSRYGTVCYRGGMSLVSVILKWPTPNISIFGVSYLYTADTYDYWYRLY